MKALCIPTPTTIAPFGDPVGEVPVQGQPLAAIQARALREAGVEPVDALDDPGQPHILYEDRTWFTAATIRRLLAAGPGRLRVVDATFNRMTAPLQKLQAPGTHALGLHPGGQGDLASLAPVDVELGLEDVLLPDAHPALAHAVQPLRVGAAMVHQIDHWSHVVRVNQLAIGGSIAGAREAWAATPWWGKLSQGLGLLSRLRGTGEHAVLAALSQTGKGCKIHPTAVVEGSVLGDGVEVGPHAVIRFSVLKDRVHIEEHATVLMSSLGEGSHVGRYGFCNLSTLYPGARISHGGGYQASVFGKDSFMAWGVTALDLSFGGHIKTCVDGADGERVNAGTHFLGVAIGHRARVGNAVRLNHGMAIPNDALLIAVGHDLLRHWNGAPVDQGPLVSKDGRAVPFKQG